MKYITFFCVFCLLTLDEQYLQGQNWLWGQQGSSSLNTGTYYSPITTDKYGNAYVTGTFNNSATFGSHVLSGNAVNAYLARFNSSGKVVWVKQAVNDSNAYTISESVTTDNKGNVYIVGNITGKAAFGKDTVGNSYGYSLFLVKYDRDGDVLWARQSGVISNSGVHNCAVATDNQGNVFVTGLFDTTTTFGPRVLTNTSTTSSNMFVVKYNSTGNVQWARQSTGAGLDNNYNYPFSIATDVSGNVYVTSDFDNSITFDTCTLHSSRYYSVYLVKYSSQGTLLWARQSVNTNYNRFGSGHSLGYGYSVVADQAGNSYITGTFQDSISFGSHTLSSTGGYSVFFIKYDVKGNVVWAQQSSQGWAGTGLAADGYNNIYISGQIVYYYLNSGILDFGGIRLNAPPDSNTASFIIKFNTDGIPYCGAILDNVGENGENTGVAADITGSYVYMGGIFYNKEVICGPDTIVSQGEGTNLLLARWNPCDTSQLVLPKQPPVLNIQNENEPCNIFVPTAFSPNQSVNNMFYVRGNCIASISFLVFDRWANKVFESNNQNFGWDGTYAGKPMNMGTYIWYLKATLADGTNVEKKGNITLVR